MGPKLSAEEIVTLSVLKSKGQSNTQIAHTLGVAEATVRYHLRRQGQPDGRQGKPKKAAALVEVRACFISGVAYTNREVEGVEIEDSVEKGATDATTVGSWRRWTGSAAHSPC